MAKTRYGCLVVALLMTILLGSSAWAADISGTITNSSTGSGRIYLIVSGQNGGDNSFGTSLTTSDPGYPAYTIKGLPPGTYSIHGFIDTRGNGSPYSGSPIGGRPNDETFTVGETNLTGINVYFMDQSAQAPVQPGGVMATPGNNSALLFWDTPRNQYDLEIADSYNVYWGTNADVGPGKTTGGSMVTVPSIGDGGHYLVPSLANGTYYIGVEAVLKGTKSAITRSAAVVVGAAAPVGSKTVSGTIFVKDKNGAAVTTAKPMFVGLSAGDYPIYMTYLPAGAAVSSRAFSIPGVAPGTYELFAFVDQNGDNRKGAGDWPSLDFDNTSPWIDVQGDVANISINVVKQNAQAQLTTRYGYSNYNNSWLQGYSLEFEFAEAEKRPAKIDLAGGSNMPAVSLTINQWGEFQVSYPLPGITPQIGDAYSGTVTFSDGTTESVNLKVTGIVTAPPVPTFPLQQTGPNSTRPTFSWAQPTLPFGAYRYRFALSPPDNGDWLMNKWLSADTLSLPLDAAVPTLATGGNGYNWQVALVDSLGNSAEMWNWFQPQSSGPQITGVSPQTLACGSATPITITGTGFSTNLFNNHVHFNNLGDAAVTSASATQLIVTLPSCNNTNVSAGPIIVTVNNVSASSGTDFIPTFTYDYYVKDNNGNALSGVAAQVEGATIPSVLSDVSGRYQLKGIPVGIPFQLKLSKAGYWDTDSAQSLMFSDFIGTGNFNLYTAADLANLNLTPGTGVIRARVTDNVGNGANLTGAIVTAYSTRYNSTSKYTVAYTNPVDTTKVVSGVGTSTHTDGKYYVLNVEEGDTVVVSAALTDYQFTPRTFVTHTNVVSQGRVIGVSQPAITGISPSSAPIGASVVITGKNFGSTPTVIFADGKVATVIGSTATQLTVSVPCGAVSGPITINVNGQTVTSGTFTIPAPTITGFSPTSTSVSETITITGTNFSSCQNDNQVIFAGSYFMPVGPASNTQLTVLAPPWLPNTTTGLITVMTTGGSVASSSNLTISPNPYPTSLNPATATPGSSVYLTGNYYDLDKTHYQLVISNSGNVSATITSITASNIIFTVPEGAGSGGMVYIIYNNVWYGNSYLTINYRLTAAISGSGGTINELSPGGILTCSGSSCTGIYSYGTNSVLRASTSTGYEFKGWSGACAGTGDCNLTMTANKSVTATFAELQYIVNGTNYYSLLQNAFDGAVAGDTIQAQAVIFTEPDLVFNKAANTEVKFKGGYDNSFSPVNSGYTTLDGKLSVRGGTLRVEKLKIK
jgi:uncharacterized repeat protein (TIGR02543 family)